MKNKYLIKRLLQAFVACILAVTLTGCEENTITALAGQMPETGGLDNTFAIFSSANQAESEVVLDMNKVPVADSCYLKLTRPATQNMNFTIAIDTSMVKSYNEANGTDYPVLPEEYITLSSKTLTLEVGKMQSSVINILVNYDQALEPGIYLLPVKVKKASGDANLAEEYQHLYYLINVWPEFEGNKYELRNKEYVQIGYLDPEILNPLIINELYVRIKSIRPATPYWYDILFDIVNLQGATIGLKDKNVNLKIKDDLNYILINKKKYIMPLQAQQHKICLSVTGGGQGIGFSNFTSEEISSIVAQIANIINIYNLDGCNILDRNNLYNFDSKNLPNIKNLIYFMACLREALPSKIITLAITQETPLEVDQTVDDIRLGNLVDYAWVDEPNYAYNPWLDNSKYKPIAGLEKNQWAIAVTQLTSNNDDLKRMFASSVSQVAAGEVDKVFVHYLGKNKAGVETSFSTLWRLGASITWPLDIVNNKWYSSDVECPIEYLDIHSDVWLKDW